MSIEYYEENSKKFIEDTFNLDMSKLYQVFEGYLKPGDTILDIGSGSGRDCRYFHNKGYNVYAHDASWVMVEQTKAYIGDRIAYGTFQDFDPLKFYGRALEFHGLWACASLLHVVEEDLIEVINRYLNYLVAGGVFFMSYKMRRENHEKDGRVFTNFTSEKLKDFLKSFDGLEILEIIETSDVRDGRVDEGWISAVVRKRR